MQLMILECAKQTLQIIELFCCIYGILRVKKTKSFWGHLVILLIANFGVLMILTLCGTDTLHIISFFMDFVILFLIMRGDWKRRVAISVFTELIVTLIELLIMMGVSVFLNKEYELIYRNFEYVVKIKSICILILLVISLVLCWEKRWVEWIKKIDTRYFILWDVSFFGVEILVVKICSYIQNLQPDDKVTLFSIMVWNVLFVIILMIGTGNEMEKRYLKIQNEWKEEVLQETKVHYEQIIRSDKEIRKLRHDMKAHIYMMTYLNQEDPSRLSDYISELGEQFEQAYPKEVRTNHHVVDAMIHAREKEMEENKIRFSVEGVFLPNLVIPDFDLCVIFSNMLSNAVEACKKVKIQERFIHLRISNYKNNLLIQMKNVCNEDVHLGFRYTTKEDYQNHGFGIENMKEYVSKYHGEIQFELENKYFIVTIILQDIYL